MYLKDFLNCQWFKHIHLIFKENKHSYVFICWHKFKCFVNLIFTLPIWHLRLLVKFLRDLDTCILKYQMYKVIFTTNIIMVPFYVILYQKKKLHTNSGHIFKSVKVLCELY